MLEGVIVTKETPIYTEKYNIKIFCTVLAVFLLVAIIPLLLMSISDGNWRIMYTLILLAPMSFVAAYTIGGLTSTTSDIISHIEYQVVVTDTVKFNEFYRIYGVENITVLPASDSPMFVKNKDGELLCGHFCKVLVKLHTMIVQNKDGE